MGREGRGESSDGGGVVGEGCERGRGGLGAGYVGIWYGRVDGGCAVGLLSDFVYDVANGDLETGVGRRPPV